MEEKANRIKDYASLVKTKIKYAGKALITRQSNQDS